MICRKCGKDFLPFEKKKANFIILVLADTLQSTVIFVYDLAAHHSQKKMQMISFLTRLLSNNLRQNWGIPLECLLHY